MSIKFQAIQHFFLFEKRPTNRMKGRATQHPFACVAVGFENSVLPEVPFRVAIAVCNGKDNFERKMGRAIAQDRLKNEPNDGRHALVAWLKPSETRSFRKVLDFIGALPHFEGRQVNLARGAKAFKNVLIDIQGKRIHPKVKVKPAQAAKKLDRIKQNLRSGMKLADAMAHA